MKKKIFSLFCAAMLVFSMGTTAFATDIDSTEAGSNTATQNVTLNATLSTVPDTISVNVTWENMSFTYTEGSAASWNPATHEEVAAGEGTWANTESSDTAKVTVTNNSNVAVALEIAYNGNAGQYEDGADTAGVTVDFTEATLSELAAGDTTNVTPVTSGSNANQTSASIKVSGTPEANLSNITAGTITVTISAV